MRKNILFIFAICFVLYGCPANHFHRYKPVEKGIDEKAAGFYFIPLDTNGVLVKIGYFNSFVKDKAKELVVLIDYNGSKIGLKNKDQLIITSKKIGFLKYEMTKDSLMIYSKKMPFKNETKNINFIKGDTINLIIDNKKHAFYYK